ncbi:MAG: iron-containing alcohol dehydrogenase, partial [Tepidisphaeraceae bacterium]
HVDRAAASLRRVGVEVRVFDEAEENPTTVCVDKAVAAAREQRIDLLIGLGGGSSMDCAKGCNFILTNGGRMQDYWGVGKATKPMLPLIAVPTTAGTGSEAQSFALITDPDTHQKMACGDKRALPALAILDADLTGTQPAKVAAATAIDAVAHAVETAACAKRTDVSMRLSREAWALLDGALESALRDPRNVAAREKMLLGAHLAGAAIENSMLGAAHACANPLTAKFGVVHGVAVGIMLPHVIRFNSNGATNPYAVLVSDAKELASRVETLLSTAGLPPRLSEFGVAAGDVPRLAALASEQWTAQFNPRPVDADSFRRIYEAAL